MTRQHLKPLAVVCCGVVCPQSSQAVYSNEHRVYTTYVCARNTMGCEFHLPLTSAPPGVASHVLHPGCGCTRSTHKPVVCMHVFAGILYSPSDPPLNSLPLTLLSRCIAMRGLLGCRHHEAAESAGGALGAAVLARCQQYTVAGAGRTG
jgi:hypothetical protein